MTTENSTVLSVRNLVVNYVVRSKGGLKKQLVHAVDDISLEIIRGKTLALVGESGSGKSSIAKAIMRLTDIDSGSVQIAGQDVTKLNGKSLQAARRNFQMIFQDPFESIDPRRTVLDTVVESLIIAGIGANPEERKQIGLQALADVGLTPAEQIGNRFAHQLSGGQRQRVAIASAMVLKPALLVADEPVSMLDVSLRAGILRTLKGLSETLGVGTLFITHDLSLAWMYADEIAVVYLGKIIEQGLAQDVISKPQHPYTKSLVSVIPSPDRNSKHQRTILVGESPDAANIPKGCAFHPRCPLYRSLGEPEICRTKAPTLTSSNHRSACHQVEIQEST
jgi:oligopeptide/dipeptide ABC transporter ATP-binding protein